MNNITLIPDVALDPAEMALAQIEAELRGYAPSSSMAIVHGEQHRERRVRLWRSLDALTRPGVSRTHSTVSSMSRITAPAGRRQFRREDHMTTTSNEIAALRAKRDAYVREAVELKAQLPMSQYAFDAVCAEIDDLEGEISHLTGKPLEEVWIE